MKRFTAFVVAATALSTAALAQVGTDPLENKVPANQVPAPAGPPMAEPAPTTDDAAPSDRADTPNMTASPANNAASVNAVPAPGDPTSASGPPPKG